MDTRDDFTILQKTEAAGAEQQRWLEHRRQVFTPEFLQAYADELQMLYQQYADDKEKLAQLKALWQYAQDIV